MLVAAPLTVWGDVETARALWSLEGHEPVDCCAALYAAEAPAAQDPEQ